MVKCSERCTTGGTFKGFHCVSAKGGGGGGILAAEVSGRGCARLHGDGGTLASREEETHRR